LKPLPKLPPPLLFILEGLWVPDVEGKGRALLYSRGIEIGGTLDHDILFISVFLEYSHKCPKRARLGRPCPLTLIECIFLVVPYFLYRSLARISMVSLFFFSLYMNDMCYN
jgi:hypothetical protein